MGQIISGKTLKKVDEATLIPKKENPQNDLLNSIKKGSSLKHVESTGGNKRDTKTKSIGMFHGEQVERLLARRKALEMESDSDSEGEWEENM